MEYESFTLLEFDNASAIGASGSDGKRIAAAVGVSLDNDIARRTRSRKGTGHDVAASTERSAASVVLAVPVLIAPGMFTVFVATTPAFPPALTVPVETTVKPVRVTFPLVD